VTGRLHDPAVRTFASDNYAGVHPQVLAALAEANGGHQTSYGDDVYTERLREVARAHFGPDAAVYPVFGGTGANVVALQAMCRPWSSVLCSDWAHITTDEGGAPERVAGLKLVAIPTGVTATLDPDDVARRVVGIGDVHHAQPTVLSLTQSTELGTVYTPDELAALVEVAHRRGLSVHMDGARISNAAASLGLPLAALTTDVGVDVLSWGGTKNGLLGAEAVVALTPDAVAGVEFIRKTFMQLPSKMRFVSAQLLALYEGDLWLSSASHANAMARRLADALADVPGVALTRPVQANAVFARLDRAAADRLRARYAFYDWDADGGEVRWMCAFDTTADDVDAFVAAARDAVAGAEQPATG